MFEEDSADTAACAAAMFGATFERSSHSTAFSSGARVKDASIPAVKSYPGRRPIRSTSSSGVGAEESKPFS